VKAWTNSAQNAGKIVGLAAGTPGVGGRRCGPSTPFDFDALLERRRAETQERP